MPCYHPIEARYIVKPDGKKKLFFNSRSSPIPWEGMTPIQIPCGKCIGCRLERARQWAVRCCYEASLHEQNCFITLTYNDFNLPANNSLVRADPQLFFKRLRKRLGFPIRYFGCGEYGERLQRPHYHAILFGVDFRILDKEGLCPMNLSTSEPSAADTQLLSGSSSSLFSSSLLAQLWPFGFNVVGSMTFESACYVARYCTKKLNGAEGKEAYESQGRLPPFLMCSTRPGIASEWFDKFGMTDVFPQDLCFARGHPCLPPRFFEKKLALADEVCYNMVKQKRELSRKDIDPARLLVLEEICRKRFDKVSRPIC